MESLEKRLIEVERRLALLEILAGNAQSSSPLGSSSRESTKIRLVELSVSNKRYDRGDYEEHIWFDCMYTLAKDSKATRAVKGVIEFSDLFGDVGFRIQATINDPMSPDKPLASPGIGFTFNQFMPEHQWMLATDLSNMNFKFSVSHVIYSDGTSEEFI